MCVDFVELVYYLEFSTMYYMAQKTEFWCVLIDRSPDWCSIVAQ